MKERVRFVFNRDEVYYEFSAKTEETHH